MNSESKATTPAANALRLAIVEALKQPGFNPGEVECVLIGSMLGYAKKQPAAHSGATIAALTLAIETLAVDLTWAVRRVETQLKEAPTQ